jgi:hypothetical protein
MKLTRNKQINLRISEKDKDRLQAEAEALNLTLSTYIIIQLNKCVMGRGSNNLNYDDGFKYERENYKIFEPVLKNILEQTN